MYGSLDISTSGMMAQRTRLTVIAANIANKDANLDEFGNLSPYREQQVMLAAGGRSASRMEESMGVHVAQIGRSQAEFNLKYDPGNPHAFKTGPKQGYVPTSNVDIVKQNVDLMEATRAYEANIAAAEATKLINNAALRLLG